jgi:hypothetical protein
MEDNDRATDGRFTPAVSDDEIVAAVRTHDPAGTADVADEIGMTRQGADRRLRELRDAGRVNKKKIGASLVWYPAETTRRAAEHTTIDAVDADEQGAAGDSSAVRDAVQRVADTDGLPASVGLDDATEAVAAVVDHLREQGPASKKELVVAVMPDYPLGYDAAGACDTIEAGDRFRGAWWRRVVRPALVAVETVEPPTPGGADYEFVG